MGVPAVSEGQHPNGEERFQNRQPEYPPLQPSTHWALLSMNKPPLVPSKESSIASKPQTRDVAAHQDESA